MGACAQPFQTKVPKKKKKKKKKKEPFPFRYILYIFEEPLHIYTWKNVTSYNLKVQNYLRISHQQILFVICHKISFPSAEPFLQLQS